MQIVDTALLKAKEEGRAVRVGIVGAGYSAKRILYQIVDGVAGMDVVALGNRTVDNAVQAMQFAGINDYKIVSSLAAMDVAIQNGQRVVAEDPALVWQSPHVDVVVDATGSVEFGAHIALGAIEHKKHIVLMNVELDATVGPILKNKADHAGVIYSNSDGDEPGVAMNMIRFVKSLGLQPVLAGNLKGLYDPYRNPTTQVEFAEALHGTQRVG